MIVVPLYFYRILLFFCIFILIKCHSNIENTDVKLEEILMEIKKERYSRDIDDGLKLWQNYEFGTGAGNREELIVTEIYVEDEETLATNADIKNWQYLPGLQYGILAGSGESNLWVYYLNLNDDEYRGIYDPVVLRTIGKILTFKVINLSNPIMNHEDIIAVLSIEFELETKLNWYKLKDGNFELISSSPVSSRVEKLNYFQHNGENKLLLINEPMNHNGAIYSSIEIYGFNFVKGLLEFWVCQRIWVPAISSIEICSIYESTFLSVQSQDTVTLYEFEESERKEGMFKHSQNITSNGLKNSLCFENGYTEYLILSGKESALFSFLENEFLYNYEMEKLLTDLGETLWVQHLPVQTYREECILLIQLKNLTIIGLSWQGDGLRIVNLPPINIPNFQLSQITTIPKYGFIYENKIVKVETTLRNLPRPVHDEMEKMLQFQDSLEVTFSEQEMILDETARRILNSYHSNPVITGIWNLSEIKTETVTIFENVPINSFTVGSKLFTPIDMASDLTVFDYQLRKLHEKIAEINRIANSAVYKNMPEVHTSSFSFNGGIEILGTLHVKNLTFESLNGFTLEEILHDFVRYDNQRIIKGSKSFSSIEADHINIVNINGVPIENVLLDTENKNYENINFKQLTQLVVNGNLDFSSINGLDWDDLMKSVIWKNHPAAIPGLTVVHGEIVADTLSVSTINGIKYPEGYVLQDNTDHAEITGEKSFRNVKILNLNGIKTINGIPYEDFVTLDSEQNLPHEITFKNLIIDENLQIDGRITGIKVNQEEHKLTLNDVNVITADTMFNNLYVTGNIIIENSVNKTTLSDIDDIVRKSETNVVINGHKFFESNVRIESKLKVTSKKYNGHDIDEFATFSSEQIFPNLKKISAPVIFEHIEYKQLNDLENYLNEFTNDDESESTCLNKKLIFNVSPIFENVGFDTINGNISGLNFAENLHRTFENISFENLEVNRLYAGEVTTNIINDIDFSDFENRRISNSKLQILSGNYLIKYLKAGELKTQRINGMSLNDLEKFRNDFEDLFDKIWNGRMIIDTFIIKGQVQTNTINGELLANIYARNELRNVIVDDGFYVQNLLVHGLVNGINLTDFVSDSVYKTDRNVVMTGEKIINSLKCQILEFDVLNGNPLEDIVNSYRPQILSGPILAKGNVVVKKSFDSYGKVNDILYKNLINRISHFENNVFNLNGNFQFGDNVIIENLHIDDKIQGINFDDFLENLIFQGDDVIISGTKIFTNSVKFEQNFTIVNEYNGMDLAPFNHHAVFIDKDINIGSEIIFEEDIIIENDLTVEENLLCKTISNVDIEELKSSAIFLDRPSYVQGTLTFTNAIFQSNMTVDYLNDIDLNAVISLKEDQLILNPISIINVSVETLGISGTVNGYQMDQIFANTFMLDDNQTIAGNLIFHGNVKMQNNFYSNFINGINTLQMISLDENEKLTGTFEFSSLLILMKDLRVFGLVNDIDLVTWENEAVYDIFPKEQSVFGNWFIRGNVSFEKDVLGTGLLNGIDVQRLYDVVVERNFAVDNTVGNIEMDLESTCKDLTPLQKYAENQIHRFKFFEYFQIMNFDVPIKSVLHFENEDVDYLLINLEECFLNTFVYNGSNGFTIISSKQDFDTVEKWIVLKYHNQIYFLTIGNGMCGKNYGNLWKFDGQTLTHILDLGSITDVKKIGDYNFLVISEERLEKWSIEDVHRGLYGNLTSYFSINKHNNMQFIPNTEKILLVENNYIHEFHLPYFNHTVISNIFGNGVILSLRVGIFEKEIFLYYDEGISENNAFILDGLSARRIRQSIPTHKPTSFLIINFDSLVETFLTFVKNGRSLEIFEYKGIEGFVYRESIKMQIDKTFGFKLRKHKGLSKTNFIGTVYGNTLKILEAEMYGRKLDTERLICED